MRSPGAPLTFRVERGGAASDIAVTPEAAEQGGKTVGLAGLRLTVDPEEAKQLAVTVRFGVVEAFAQGARKTWELSVFTLKMLGRIVIGEASVQATSAGR